MAKLVSLGLGATSGKITRSALTILADSFVVGIEEGTGIPGVQFTTTDDGRGTGAQFVPLDRLADFCDTLEGFAEPGAISKRAQDTDPVAVMRDTMSFVKGPDEEVTPGEPIMVAFRTKLGQGQKPTRLPLDEIRDVADFLRSRIESSEVIVRNALAAAKKKA